MGVWACVWACGRVGVWACGRVGVFMCRYLACEFACLNTTVLYTLTNHCQVCAMCMYQAIELDCLCSISPRIVLYSCSRFESFVILYHINVAH